jgi:hypothetical protein
VHRFAFERRCTGSRTAGQGQESGTLAVGTGEKMAIKKQEFYEGAALHLLARTGRIAGVRFDAPFFLLNNRCLVLLKHSTKGRSPWSFTLTENEQSQLREMAAKNARTQLKKSANRYKTKFGLICGDDGVVALDYEEYLSITAPGTAAVHIACYRKHGEHYEVCGPGGSLPRKIAPSSWQKILDD